MGSRPNTRKCKVGALPSRVAPEGDLVYLSYDRFPSPKGAAVHINAFVRALSQSVGSVDLVTPPAADPGFVDVPYHADSIRHVPLPAVGANLIERVLCFRARLNVWWEQRRQPCRVAHVRSIYEGYAVARNRDRWCERLVFEVNGLPSIELKYHYAAVAEDDEFLTKVRAQEDTLLAACDRIITVSATTSEYLVTQRGVDPDRVTLIPNGVDTTLFEYRAPELGRASVQKRRLPVRLVYWGTLSAWQGVLAAIDSVALIRREQPVTLTLIGPQRARSRKQLIKYAHRVGVADCLQWRDPVPQAQLAASLHEHDIALAPLVMNDRNLVQGCCPLKVLEAMAAGIPLVASDLPVVRELCRADEEAVLVRPGSGKAIKDGVLRLLADPQWAVSLAQRARARVERQFTWERAQHSLVALYQDLLNR